MKKLSRIPALLLLLALSFLFNACYIEDPIPSPTPPNPNAIQIGAIVDLSGPTSREGREYAAGIRDYVAQFNAASPIPGYRIELSMTDYGYKAPLAIEAYQRFVRAGVVGVIGWSSPDTLAITSQLASGKTPFFSASYRDDVARKVNTDPYNFLVTPSYSDQMRMLLQFGRVFYNETSHKMGVANLMVDNEFGRYPLQAGRDYATAKDFFWFFEGFINPTNSQPDIRAQVKRLSETRPDLVIIQSEPALAAALVAELKKANITGKYAGLATTGGQEFLNLAGSAAQGFYAGVTLPYPTDPSPGMDKLKKSWAATPLTYLSDNDPEYKKPDQPGERYIQGWLNAQVLLEGVRLAKMSGPLTVDNVRAALETLSIYTADGLLPPLGYSATNHKGTGMRVYQVDGTGWKTILPNTTLADLEKMPVFAPPTPTPKPRR